MRRLIVLAVAAAIALPLSAATEPNPSARQRQIIEQIFQTMNMNATFKSLVDSIFAQIQKQFLDDAAAKGNDPEDIEEAKELFTIFRARAAKVDLEQLIHEAQIRIYAKYFTENELTDIATFYQSPTGKKTVALLPQIMADGMQAGAETLDPKLKEILAEAMDEQEHNRPWRRTMSDMRALATAIEAYQTDQQDETYPAAADMAGLKEQLKGITMSQKFPEKDMWGHAYEYVVSPDRKHYRIVSAGADGIFEWDSRKIDVPPAGTTPAVRYRDRLEDDIIYADGNFVQLPIQAKPKPKN